MSASPYKQLEQEFKRLHAFRGALALLRWDAAVMMPRGSADVRGEQVAALETEHHALLTAPRITRLLDRAQANTQGLLDWQVANLREMRRQRDHAIATPATLVSRLAKATSRAESKWLEARTQGKFEVFAPHLEEVVHLVRDKAALLGQARNLAPYDALVDEYSPGLTTVDIDAIFRAFSKRLPSLIREAIALQEQAIRLSPRDPYIGIWCLRIGFGHLLRTRTDQAIAWFEKARGANRGLPKTHGCLAAAFGLKGWIERASAELAEAQRLSDGRYSSIARLKAAGQWGLPAIQSLFETTYFAGLRRAGVPEE